MPDLTTLCQFAMAVLSHSWHDDPEQKWRALQRWSLKFEERHGRTPVLWFDKVPAPSTIEAATCRCALPTAAASL